MTKAFFSSVLTATLVALKHGFAGAAVVVGLFLCFLLPIWTKLVYLDGRYMNPELGLWTFLVNDLPAMLGILVIYTVYRCYRSDRKKGAAGEH